MKIFSKIIFVNCVLLLSFSKTHSQYVTIPDANFVTWLNNNGYAGCINGNLMDTTCNPIVTDTLVNCGLAGINNLDGIQYFDNLQTLNCSNSSSTPMANRVNNISALPPNLKVLYSNDNAYTALPILPATLILIQSLHGSLQSLPALPSGINEVQVFYNQIASLPSLPASLEILSCFQNNLTSLPTLPNGLKVLRCGWNDITVLPPLPDSLRELNCRSMSVSLALPVLPDSLNYLECSANNWTTLPTLPSHLQSLLCYNNQLTALPAFPSTITELGIGYNPLAVNPVWPPLLYFLNCTNNNFTTLPALPATLHTLSCDNNPLSALPTLPQNLTFLNCSNCNLFSVPDLPDNFSYLNISNNLNLACFPKYKNIQTLSWTNTSISCLPNAGNINSATPSIANLPLCLSISGCDFDWSMFGKIYNDLNQNCLYDTSEARYKNLRVELDSGGATLQSFIFNSEGYYSFKTGYGNYEIKIDTTGLPFDVVCPPSAKYISSITAVDSTDQNLDFGLLCKPGFFDLMAKSISAAHVLIPGHQSKLFLSAGDATLFYGVTCSAGIGGTVQAILSGPVSYVSPDSGAITPTSVMSDTITWNISNLSLINPEKDFNIIISVDTTATIFDTVCVQLNISPTTDSNPLNNSFSICFSVASSFDPNAKEVFPAGDIDTTQRWLTYTIYFQNTGTAPAENIYLLDQLDASLDANTFQYLSSDHDPVIQILSNNMVRFSFPNINLPDSTNDEPHSHGYVQYKIKLKNGLAVGTTIYNMANIYFDFNLPVGTNITENTIVNTTAVNNFQSENMTIKLFPNPVKENLSIVLQGSETNNYECRIFDVIGKQIFSQQKISASTKINLYGFSKGLYVVEVKNKNQIQRAKIIKE